MKTVQTPPLYRLTKRIALLLSVIEANNELINNFALPLEVEENIRRKSILGSALFSARIEGNTLTRDDLPFIEGMSRKDRRRIEVANLQSAISYVLRTFKNGKKITRGDLLKMHQMAMKNVLEEGYLGRFRDKHEGVFDSIGNLVYHAPPPSQVGPLVEKLLNYVNSSREKLVPVKAVLAHLALENIHPFADGSGRVGRLLQLAVLSNNGYGMRGFASVEEIIDRERARYYRSLEESRGVDSTVFVELILSFLEESSTKAKEEIMGRQGGSNKLDLLLPRRREIVEIIKEHRLVSLDFLHRRFLRVSSRLLSYDLRQLCNQGFVYKVGSTRGAMYAVKE